MDKPNALIEELFEASDHIEAYQMTASRLSAPDNWPDWLNAAIAKGAISSTGIGMVLGDGQTVPADAYIIKGSHGEIYFCDWQEWEAKFRRVWARRRAS